MQEFTAGSFYEGPATLLDDKGNEAALSIEIVIDASEALKCWSATATTDSVAWDLHDGTRLRLPDGREGRVVVNQLRWQSWQAGSLELSLLGNGEPPS